MTTTRSTEGLSVTTQEHPSARTLRAAFESFARGDLEGVRATMAPDAVWTAAGTSPLAGTYRGWDEIQQMMGRAMELTGGTFSAQLVSVLADDSHAVAVHDITATVGGRTETHRCVLVDELDEQGRARAVHVMAYDQDAHDRHLSG